MPEAFHFDDDHTHLPISFGSLCTDVGIKKIAFQFDNEEFGSDRPAVFEERVLNRSVDFVFRRYDRSIIPTGQAKRRKKVVFIASQEAFLWREQCAAPLFPRQQLAKTADFLLDATRS